MLAERSCNCGLILTSCQNAVKAVWSSRGGGGGGGVMYVQHLRMLNLHAMKPGKQTMSISRGPLLSFNIAVVQHSLQVCSIGFGSLL